MAGKITDLKITALAMKILKLPRYDGNGFAKLGEDVIVPSRNGRYIALADVVKAIADTGAGQ